MEILGELPGHQLSIDAIGCIRGRSQVVVDIFIEDTEVFKVVIFGTTERRNIIYICRTRKTPGQKELSKANRRFTA